MNYRIEGLPPELFQHLVHATDAELAHHHAERQRVDASHTFPCRVSLEDAAEGETVILLNYQHQPQAGPYQSSHAIYVRDQAQRAGLYVNTLPPQFLRRLLSVRAFDGHARMPKADVAEGTAAEALILQFLADPAVAYLHVHYARRGCFAGKVVRHPI